MSIKQQGLFLILAVLLGALIMDYYNYTKAKSLNYTKRSGFFKYYEKQLI